jgi:hypothetical protein
VFLTLLTGGVTDVTDVTDDAGANSWPRNVDHSARLARVRDRGCHGRIARSGPFGAIRLSLLAYARGVRLRRTQRDRLRLRLRENIVPNLRTRSKTRAPQVPSVPLSQISSTTVVCPQDACQLDAVKKSPQMVEKKSLSTLVAVVGRSRDSAPTTLGARRIRVSLAHPDRRAT